MEIETNLDELKNWTVWAKGSKGEPVVWIRWNKLFSDNVDIARRCSRCGLLYRTSQLNLESAMGVFSTVCPRCKVKSSMQLDVERQTFAQKLSKAIGVRNG